MANLEDEIKNFLDNSERVSRIKEALEKRLERLKEFEKKLNSKEGSLKKELENSDEEDDIFKYTFLNYGERARETFPIVNDFISKLENMAGNQLLIWYSSGSWSSSALDNNGQMSKGNFDESIILSRLSDESPVYEISNDGRRLYAVTNQAYRFSPSKGFERLDDKNRLIGLDEFINTLTVKNMVQNPNWRDLISYMEDRANNEKRSEKLPGFTVQVPVPVYTRPENKPFGGSTSYDSTIKSKLIVGDERVESFKEGYDFIATKKETYTPEIPDL